MGTTVETKNGLVEGIQIDNHQVYLGIPYASPPIGEFRFRAPRPPEDWAGIRQTKTFSASSIQGKHFIPGFAADGPVSEDCLYLNIYTPRVDNKKRPVMFWIHGGGFTHGSSDSPIYNGGFLAERGDVVVVTINYRLGVLGYLYLGGHGGDQRGAEANRGQLDQIAALKWVHDNIAYFGGDPENVTIFGESAGAAAVVTLMAMPEASGLFHRAIAQSGTANNLQDSAQASELAEKLFQELNVSQQDIHKLWEIPAEELLEAQANVLARIQAEGLTRRFSPVVDGKTLVQQPFEAITQGDAGHISFMLGTNRDEVKLFKDFKNIKPITDEEIEKSVEVLLTREAKMKAAEVILVYRESRVQHGLPTENIDILDAINTDIRFRLPCIRLAEAHGQAYNYLFTWESPAGRGTLGACHALEMPFVFGTLHHPMEVRFTGEGPEADRLSQNMMDAWISFAHTGDPNHQDLNKWMPYDRKRRATMIFSRESGIQNAPFEEERTVWE